MVVSLGVPIYRVFTVLTEEFYYIWYLFGLPKNLNQ